MIFFLKINLNLLMVCDGISLNISKGQKSVAVKKKTTLTLFNIFCII